MPIPRNFQIKKEEKKDYPPLQKNIYQMELLAIDLIDKVGKYAKEGEKTFKFQFVLLAPTELRGRSVWCNFVPTSLYIGKTGKNELYQIVETYLRRELSREEEATGITGELLNSFIGKQIKGFIDQNLGKDGKTIYNNITSYIVPENPLEKLSEEEKEKCKVKAKKTEEPKEEHQFADNGQAIPNDFPVPEDEPIDVSNIPF